MDIISNVPILEKTRILEELVIANCKSSVFIQYPLLKSGLALIIRDHDQDCSNVNTFIKASNLDQKEKEPCNDDEKSDLNLKEIIKDIMIKDPSIKSNKVALDIRNKFPKYFTKISATVKYVVKQIKEDFDFNSLTFAFKNPNTVDNQHFLRGHGLTFIQKGKETKNWSIGLQIQSLRAINAKHFFIDGTFDTARHDFIQKLVIMTNDLITNHPKRSGLNSTKHKR